MIFETNSLSNNFLEFTLALYLGCFYANVIPKMQLQFDNFTTLTFLCELYAL